MFILTSLCCKIASPWGENQRKAHTLWYFFASRDRRVYPLCREDAVRLLRSTRMSRAHSEASYSSDYDYERYCNALLQHLCIWHLVVSSSRLSFVFNLSLIVRLMTEKDILSDICFLKKSSQLWSCVAAHEWYTTDGVSGGSELLVLLLSAVCILVML